MGEPARELLEASQLWRPLTLHDAALINAVGAAVVAPIPDPDELRDALRMIETLSPLVSRDHVLMRDLAAAAAALVDAFPLRGGRAEAGELNRWARAEHDARVALAAVMRVRAAQVFGKIFEGVAR